MIMLNTPRAIDNPYQDIALFRFFVHRLSACLKMNSRGFDLCEKWTLLWGVETAYCYWWCWCETGTQEKLQRFFNQFEHWRNLARRGSLSNWLASIYDTHYYEWFAMPNGKRCHESSRASWPCDWLWENIVPRFIPILRFIDRMRKRGDDLGKHVRLVKGRCRSVDDDHSSKGLEFPHVFNCRGGTKV